MVNCTSITDVIAFCAGAASVFPSVRNFSWYTGMYIKHGDKTNDAIAYVKHV
jgi:hypothetical protein